MGKIIQMFDVFNIRFGATLVGPTGAGKTTCYKMLAAVMTDLRNKGSVNPEFQVSDGFLDFLFMRGFENILQQCVHVEGYMGEVLHPSNIDQEWWLTHQHDP